MDAISGSHASDVRDILQGAKGLHDYRFSTTAEPRYEEVEGSLVDLSVTLLEIYPNPARDEIFVNYNFDNRPGSKIRLFDVAGKLFKEVPAAYDHSVFKLDVSDLPTGIYILAIQNEDGFVAKGKFVKLAE
mgnify:FL=1